MCTANRLRKEESRRRLPSTSEMARLREREREKERPLKSRTVSSPSVVSHETCSGISAGGGGEFRVTLYPNRLRTRHPIPYPSRARPPASISNPIRHEESTGTGRREGERGLLPYHGQQAGSSGDFPPSLPSFRFPSSTPLIKPLWLRLPL